MSILNSIAYHSKSLIINATNNIAEEFNSIIAKFLGGKRINYCLGESYKARCNAAAVSHNTRTPLSEVLGVVKKSRVGKFVQKYERKKPDMPEELYSEKKERFLTTLQVTAERRDKIEKETRLQRDSPTWLHERRKRLTASHFGSVCIRLAHTSCKNLVKAILYSNFDNRALRYGREHEKDAIRELETNFDIKVSECGLFVSTVSPYLGATPDGLVDGDGLVEVNARCRPGEFVLIHGSSGAVGLAAVQIAKHLKLKVAGTAGTEEGMALIKRLGANFAVCHREYGYMKEIMHITGGYGTDIVLEMLANVNLDNDLDIMARRGRIVIVGSRGCTHIDPRKLMSKELTVSGCALMDSDLSEWKEMSTAVIKMCEEGIVKPVIDRKYALADAAKAHYDIINNSGAKGKLILIVNKNLKNEEQHIELRGSSTSDEEEDIEKMDHSDFDSFPVEEMCNVSVRDAVRIIAAAAEALDANLQELSLSRTTVRARRQKFREQRANIIKNRFQNSDFSTAVLHWDGKLVSHSSNKDAERLAVLISCGDEEQLIGVPEIENSKGLSQAKAVFSEINKWGAAEKIEAMCFDTTAANTGCWKGTCTLLY
ncbi:hypothetical protein JTE90_028997 [Oedothorax gibbosus]|uniref:Enoyl reductase (ER) domain-containing protein n=1 Tax=Oedothorax gibbosus TaxID=931172 RepID=A0AAV6VHL0_9ARAC|nr:hypothetical protein JTE90_028997 [Oedothorax gibbosus]